MANVTGRWMAADRRRIQSTSSRGATMSSPAEPAGASSKMPVPSSPRAAPMPKSSSSAAKVPGTGSPSMARWAIVRDVENPRAPAAIASLTTCLHGGDVLRGGRLVAGAALAHHVGAHRAVGDLGADVDGPRSGGRGRRGTRGRSPSPRSCPRSGRCPGCPPRPPSGRSATRGGRGGRGRSPPRSCPSPAW